MDSITVTIFKLDNDPLKHVYRGKKEKKKKKKKVFWKMMILTSQDLSIYLLFFTKNPVEALNFSLQKDYNHRFVMDFTGYACIISTVY